MQTVTTMIPLIEQLREAARLREVDAIAQRIKRTLEAYIPDEGLRLPERFRQAKPEGYCRRLLYRDEELGFTAVVMTWGPGQRTALHDHSGIWCVEGVLEGEMEVSRFEMQEEVEPGVFRFVGREHIKAAAGEAGALIPPLEHHVLANNRPDQVSLTLHVYGGDMDHCTVFEPVENREGLYQAQQKALSYDA
ncbi:MAG TPA: cysteine dioxygenase family protein [Thermoanaerobaculia bacterium]|nr:cysteine dioxygenase family protein [Thermoanaerobaculia bacterium]